MTEVFNSLRCPGLGARHIPVGAPFNGQPLTCDSGHDLGVFSADCRYDPRYVRFNLWM